MTTYRFTAREKAEECAREIEMRRRVYSAKVARGEWTQRKADMHIAIMQAIANDYRDAAEADDLFAPVTVRVPLEPTAEQIAQLELVAGRVAWKDYATMWRTVLAIFRPELRP